MQERLQQSKRFCIPLRVAKPGRHLGDAKTIVATAKNTQGIDREGDSQLHVGRCHSCKHPNCTSYSSVGHHLHLSMGKCHENGMEATSATRYGWRGGISISLVENPCEIAVLYEFTRLA